MVVWYAVDDPFFSLLRMLQCVYSSYKGIQLMVYSAPSFSLFPRRLLYTDVTIWHEAQFILLKYFCNTEFSAGMCV